jgi:hypothetical protein
MKYEHTQTGWPMRICFGIAAVGMLVAATLTPDVLPPTARAVFAGGAIATGLLGWVWGALTIRIADGKLHWRFGLGWPRKSVPLARITGVETTRTTFCEGWGVHRTRRGWLYNVAGRDAVLIRQHDGKSFLLGTDEPRKLRNAIERAAATVTRSG